MPQFAVTPDDLRSFASELSKLIGELAQAGNFTPDVSAAGSPIVESSMQSFFSDWSQGLNTIQQNLSKLSGALSSAGGAYQKTETSLTGSFGSFASG
jgi:hypothetical protein